MRPEGLGQLWFVEGEGTDDQRMVFRAKPSAVNRALRGAQYRSLHEGNDSLTLAIADPAGSQMRPLGGITLQVGPPRPWAEIPEEVRFPPSGALALLVAGVTTLLLVFSRLVEPWVERQIEFSGRARPNEGELLTYLRTCVLILST